MYHVPREMEDPAILEEYVGRHRAAEPPTPAPKRR